MFSKILIANRGEVAVRIIRACQEMNIPTVAVYSDVDERLPFVGMANEAISLGDPLPTKSYLNIPLIIQVAQETESEAIHPGYGFLSENAFFAESCENADITFIGPRAEAIRLIGDKIEAKKRMVEANVPVIPGYLGDEDQSDDAFVNAAEEIGFPIMIKASAGGGGKGMRIVDTMDTFLPSLQSARREAESSFGDGRMLLEKKLERPRHIEFQILGDVFGHVIHLFERECSIQRRHQKIIEETPSLAISPELCEEMGEAAVRAAKAVGYTNAGTIEFMLDEDKKYYFMEMNTRLQVEHAITEATTGVDLVNWQIRLAAGMPMTVEQHDITRFGHAVECRIYAEDPENSFLPTPGMIYRIEPPQGVNIRNDVGITSGIELSPYYDPMIAKLIVNGENREECIRKMIWALNNYIILGTKTNRGFLTQILDHPAFRRGNTPITFIDDHMNELFNGPGIDPQDDDEPDEEKDSIPLDAILSFAVFDELNLENGSSAQNGVGFRTPDPYSPWKNVGRWRLCQTSKGD